MTERSIQIGLYYAVKSEAICALPNWTPPGWFECDLAVVTKAGYLTEYEIKLSASDLVADRKKHDIVSRYIERQKPIDPHKRFKRFDRLAFKHDLMRQSNARGPARYYMVVPESLTDHPAIPHWAGIVRARDFGNIADIKVIRQPTRLHGHSVSRKLIAGMYRTSYYRAWSMICAGGLIAVDSPADGGTNRQMSKVEEVFDEER